MYKNQLQKLAQRSCFNLPSYACVREGPDHAPRFKATVNFNGETFESPAFCSTLRQAEHAAAEVALNELSKRGPSLTLAAKVLDETGIYKNLLQETAHRAGLKLPVYTTVRSGPVFTCTVELAGKVFTGNPGKTKKQAQKNAAMAAWSELKQLPRVGEPSPSSCPPDQDDEEQEHGIARSEEPPYNSALGAMGSLLERLNKLPDTCDMGSISYLKDDIRSICDMLKNLSNVHDPPLTAKYWMKHARELSYDMEDYFDELDAKAEDYSINYSDPKNEGYPVDSGAKTAESIDDSHAKKDDYLDDSAGKISGFRTRVMGMIERYKRFNLHSVLHGATATTALVSQCPSRDVVLVGMDNKIENLCSLLEPTGNKYNQLNIVSILGVQGVGKSTLIQKIWCKLESEENFKCRAFVRTAKKPDIRVILRSTLSQVRPYEAVEDSGVPNLIHDIKMHLQHKRYFIIIEDLWEVSVWDVVRHAFPDCSVGSRIIITTTDEDVALACCSYDSEHNYIMEPLSLSHCKELFIRTVVGSGNGNPQLSHDVSVEIERKCGGLPLAIIWTASLVANQSETKQKLRKLETEHELCKPEEVHNLDSDVKIFLQNNLGTYSTPVEILNQVLKLCYNNLPHHLKTCLLYLSMYPENYLILKQDLLNLWIAEGFVSTTEEEDKIQVASSYFDVLVSLGFIQRIDFYSNNPHLQGEVVEEDGEEGPDRLSYVVHPTVSGFVTHKSMEDNFITVIDYSQPTVALRDKIRRLALHFGSATYGTTPASTGLSQVRTLSFIGLLSCMPSLIEFKLVRVVILHVWADDRDTGFPLADICELLLLRYLKVRCNVTVQLPGRIGCLKHLETLEINSKVSAVPDDIEKHPRLVRACLGGKTYRTQGGVPPVASPIISIPPTVASQKAKVDRLNNLTRPVRGTTHFSNLPEDSPSIQHKSDPVATVEKIVRIGLKISAAMDMVRHNKEVCSEIRWRVLRFNAILSQLQQRGMADGSPALSGALEDLEETLQHALELVTACQETSIIRRFIAGGELSKKLQRVKDDILNKVMLASFAIYARTTIVLLTKQAGGDPHLPRQQDEDAGVEQISHCSHSTPDPRSELNAVEKHVVAGSEMPFAPLLAAAIREFKWSELKEATDDFSDGNIIGKGGTFIIYKGVLKDGNVVAIKRSRSEEGNWLDSYDRVVLAVSKLRHNNIVKFIGHSHEAPFVMKIFKRKTDQSKKKELFWVEEYVPNGSLFDIVTGRRDSKLDWSSLFRIIEGVAQGLHYLHEQRVIHMDVKPGNILLDSNMNPVITDFNISLVLDDNDEMANINIAGTMGYMDPEFVVQSNASTKSDVYGFGITLLEAVGSMYRSMPVREFPLDNWAWKAWEAGRIDQEFEPTLSRQQIAEIKRCVHIGLLCAQRDRVDRPTMTAVLEMLHGDQELPTPKIPGYIESVKDNWTLD